MTFATENVGFRNQVLIRVDTLIRLRWYAIIGQLGAIIFVAFGFKYEMPWVICLLLVAISAALNLVLMKVYKASHRLFQEGAFKLLAFDILQTGLLLFLTGGLENPFSILLMAPVVVSSTSLQKNHTVILGALAVSMISLISFVHFPLPWEAGQPLSVPATYKTAVWVALVCTLAFTSIYAFRVAEETRKLADALTATELILQREHHLSALDGLAAAAAHELGTPLATIALVSKEMVHAFPADSPMREDAELLRSQARRCHTILKKLTSLSSEGEPIIEKQSLFALIEEEVGPLRDFGVEIIIIPQDSEAPAPAITRSPGIHYGVGNLIDNAVDFAESTVVIALRWDEQTVRIEISDDGPGFPAHILDKLGEPFVSSRPIASRVREKGMGLGLFIAKTLLERSGAEVNFANRVRTQPHKRGAFISIVWPRYSIDYQSPQSTETVQQS